MEINFRFLEKLTSVLVFIITCCSCIACLNDNMPMDYETKLSSESDSMHINSKNDINTEARKYNYNANSGFVFSNKIFSSMEDSRDM